jgi:hypothetical protein
MTDIDQRQVSAIVMDAEALGCLTPTAVATYLVKTGWARTGERNAGTVWTRRFDGGVNHLFQPEDPARPDYRVRGAEMLTTLASVDGRSLRAILTDLCGAVRVAATPAADGARGGRTDWMEPEYGLRRPELALVLDLAARRVERHAFVLELERRQWPLSDAAELADLVAECELTAAESPRESERSAR